MKTAFIAWILTLMAALPARYREKQAVPWASTEPDTAAAIADGCLTPDAGPWEPAKCAAQLVVVAFHESRFRPNAVGDVDASVHSFGLFQIQAPTLGREVPRDAPGQVHAALELLHHSFDVCRDRPENERLAWYMAGGKGCDVAHGMSRFRTSEADRLLRAHPFDAGPDGSAP